jgi:hypothetical protein
MTTYYVRTSGNDTADGMTPATAWLTISKALGATGIASGDTVYIGPGAYREQVTVNMTSATAETFVIGDVFGSHTGDTPGEVRLTNYLTDDTTAPTNQSLMNLNARDHLTFQYISFVSGYTSALSSPGINIIDAFSSTPNDSQYITFRDCSFLDINLDASDRSNIFNVTTGLNPTDTFHWLIERCQIVKFGTGYVFELTAVPATQSAVADIECDFVVQNCSIQTPFSEKVFSFTGNSGATFYAGGAIFRNNTVQCLAKCVNVQAGSTTYPVLVYNNILFSTITWGDYAISASIADSVIEDYNYIIANPARENTDAGAHSVDDGSYALLINFGQELFTGNAVRPWGTPSKDSPLLGFGNHASAPDTDAANRPRPASLNGDYSFNSIGAYELHDTAQDETTIYDSSPASQKIVGPGDQDYELPVLAEETVITIKVLYDDAHGTTNKPQVQILANPVIGYAGETLTSDGEPNGWATLEFAAFTPTDRGVVTLRCMSRSASGSGVAYFDTITVNGA